VHLIGYQWRPELAADWHIRRVRLEHLRKRTQARLHQAGYDLLIVWHEYPAKPRWRRVWQSLGCDDAAFQHGTNLAHPAGTYDGVRSRLYCYSPEMIMLYADQRPRAELAVHQGLGEDEPPGRDGKNLVWVGRIHPEKAPHLAVMAAERLGRRIRLAGPVFDTTYMRQYRKLFGASHVELVGEVGGAAKTAELHHASVFVYTCARAYVEAGAAVFGESLRAGTPVAALSWRPGTCAEAALCADTGSVAQVNPADSDDQAATALAATIEQAATLRATAVQEIGMTRFDPAKHFRVLASRPA